MRILISSLLVALASLAGAALTSATAASPGAAVSHNVDVAAPAVEKATFGWRRGRRHYGYGYGWRPRRYYYGDDYGYGWRPRYYGYGYHRPYYGYRRYGYGRHYW